MLSYHRSSGAVFFLNGLAQGCEMRLEVRAGILALGVLNVISDLFGLDACWDSLFFVYAC